jgi:hypothetical protein
LIGKKLFKVTFGRFAAAADYFANPLVNWTCNGMSPLGLISFWPKRVMPLCAGYRER